MLGLFKKKPKEIKRDDNLYTPASGIVKNISASSDAMFSDKMMGDGIVIFPTSGELSSPVTGEVVMIAETKHAIALRTASNVEVLIHIGVDTVNLKGAPFDLKIKVGDILEHGDILGTMDIDQIKAAELSPEILVALTNYDDKVSQLILTEGSYDRKSQVGKIVIK